MASLPDPSPNGTESTGHAGEHVIFDRGAREGRALWIALMANAALLVLEVGGGIAFGSLALLADAGHLLTDVVTLGLAVAALRLARRAPTPKHTFGFERAEVLAAQVNSLLLVGVMVWIVMEAAHRLRDPGSVDAWGMLAIATVALVVNAASALVLARSAGDSLNMRGAYLHLATDAVGSLAAMVAAVLILGWGLLRADPIASLVTAAFVGWAAFGLVRATIHVLMEGAPHGLDTSEVQRALFDADDVVDVHHVHLWSLASDVPAMSAHVVLTGMPSLADAQRRGDELKTELSERFGISHVTLELECEDRASEAAPT